MTPMDADVAIVGSGFAGSLAALVLRRIGLKPVLLERGTHPRFALGESSTPIADFVLRRLAREYDLPRLLPLTHYGAWTRTYPEVMRGLKRGFSYFQHRAGQRFEPDAEHTNELMVAASPDDERADTHWYRADFDYFLVCEAQNDGIHYFDHVELDDVFGGPLWRLEGRAAGRELCVRARFLMDASGEGMVLARRLDIPMTSEGFRTHSRSIYGHFSGVRLWNDLLAGAGAATNDHPFPCDAAALHHVFEGGWMWVLRFDHGIVSAGFCLDPRAFPLDAAVPAEQEWRALLDRFPSIAAQFGCASAEAGIFRTGRLQRCARQAAGENWAMLPSSAGRLDALHSTGNAHSLCALERLLGFIERNWSRPALPHCLKEYERTLLAEFDLMDMLVHGSYLGFGCFEAMCDFTMLYFAAATFSEHRRRTGTWDPESGFLLACDPQFRAAVGDIYGKMLEVSGAPAPAQTAALRRMVRARIGPYNLFGLCDPVRRNMYPYAAAPVE